MANRKPVIGDAVRDRLPLWAHCEACGHTALLEAAAVAGKVGYDTTIVGLRGRLRCRECGSRKVDVRIKYPSPDIVTRHH